MPYASTCIMSADLSLAAGDNIMSDCDRPLRSCMASIKNDGRDFLTICFYIHSDVQLLRNHKERLVMTG